MSEIPAVYRTSAKELPGVIESIESFQPVMLHCSNEEQCLVLLKARYEGVRALDEAEICVLDELIKGIDLPAFEVYHEETEDLDATLAAFQRAAKEHRERKANLKQEAND